VVEVDGRRIGTSAPGAMTARLQGLFREVVSREGEVVVERGKQAR
jgi:hypothetical protein